MKKLQLIALLIISNSVFSQDLQINWQKCFDVYYSWYAEDIVFHYDAYYLVGFTEPSDNFDVLLIKTDTLGNELWRKTYGGSASDLAYGIYPSGDDLIIIGGTQSNDGDISSHPYYPSLSNWVVKIDTTGSIIWDKVIGGSKLDEVTSHSYFEEDGLMILNRTTSYDGDISNHYGFWDAWYVKIDHEGDIEFDFTLGTEGYDQSRSAIKTSDGGYLLGNSSNLSDGGNIGCEPYNSNADAVLAKLDSNGVMEWHRCYGGSNNDGVFDILEIDNGYLITATGASDDGDCEGCGYHNPGYDTDDVWVMRTDKYGNVIWQKCYGGTGDERGFHEVFETSDNGYIYFGITYTNTEYGPNGDISYNPAFPDNESIWVFKTETLGNLLWERCIGGQGSEDVNFGVIQKDDDTYVLLGSTGGPYPNHDLECTNIPNGEFCWWLMELTDLTVDTEYIKPNLPEVTIFPNPGNDFIELDTQLNEFTFSLYNAKANNVIESQNQKNINTSFLKSGIYFYRILKDGEVYGSGKWVKR